MNMKNKLTFIFFFLLVNNSFAQPTQDYSQKFNGDQIFISTNNTTLNLGSTFTMEAWVYLKSASAYGIVMGKTLNPRSNDPFQNYVISFDSSGLKPEVVQTTGISGSYSSATSPTPIILNTWTHLAASLNLGILKLYVNGILAATQSSPGIPNILPDVPFSIGSGATPNSQTTCCGITGSIKQVRIWNTERTDSQILSNKDINLTGSELGLLACYPMNESSGQLITDISPNANNLTRGITLNAESQDPLPALQSNLGTFFTFTEISLPANANNYDAIYAVNYNNDAYDDILVSSIVWPPTMPASSQPLLAFTNNGNMNFSSTNAFVGNNQVVSPRDYCIGDFNGDNKTDLFIADHGTDISPFPGGQNQLFFQNASGQLVNTPANIPTVLDFSHNTATADIDNDGDLDIYVCNINGSGNIGPRLLVNNGNGNFTVSTNLPSNIVSLNYGSVYMSSRFADIDKDGDMDLILGNLGSRGVAKDLVLLNNGTGIFTAGSPLPNRYGNSNWGTVSVTVADLNNDTWPDLLMSTLDNYQTCQIQLLINNKNGTFTDATSNIPQSWGSSNTWINWIETGDFNNDGQIDFVCSVFGSSQPKLYFNIGNANFIDASDIITIPTGTGILSLKARDFDNDGRVDVAFMCGTKVIIGKNIQNYVITNLSNDVFVKDKINNIIVYPNPFSNNLMFSLNNDTTINIVSIIDINGKILIKTIPVNDEINVNHLEKGIYFMKVETNNGTKTIKIIKD
jgi:hypothetical protein